ncbi:MAG: glycosyltransferase [Candidatus Daviesbacteria bacterium]|nr:glycosyltransferase [Candidatus Daviesbacteria bacterium]
MSVKTVLQPKVAIVHDYLREYGGAERVLEALHEIYPEAPIYTAYLNLEGLGLHRERIKDWNIKTSWLQNLPLANYLISPLRILAPMIFEGFDLKEYDLVISSCNTYFSKAVITKPNSLHISYIHTPPRYLYGYATSFNYKKNPLTRILGEIANHFLRLYDFEVSERPDVLVANSKNVASRIQKFYRRDSVVIYPPVDIEKFKKAQTAARGDYFLSVGRLVRGKGVDIIVRACSELGVPLKVVGSGPELAVLRRLAGRSVEFIGSVADTDLPSFYANAQATIVASVDEDFGIVPVESMASGTPVIAFAGGGFLETVISGKTGEFFKEATAESLIRVLENFEGSRYESEDCQKQAEKFSEDIFKRQILKLVADHLKIN